MKIIVSKDNEIKKSAFAVRKTVFIEEQGFFDQLDSTDDIAWHAAAYDGEKVVGCGRMFSEGKGKYHVGRIAVLKDYRRTGVGCEIMKALEDVARSEGVEYLVLSAQRRAVDFYLALGYKIIGDEYLEEGYPHVHMEKLI